MHCGAGCGACQPDLTCGVVPQCYVAQALGCSAQQISSGLTSLLGLPAVLLEGALTGCRYLGLVGVRWPPTLTLHLAHRPVSAGPERKGV